MIDKKSLTVVCVPKEHKWLRSVKIQTEGLEPLRFKISYSITL
jgi:hypothetical protein